MDYETRYQKLNARQKQAVDTIDGPVMVIAGPGTGKTELIGMRAANILQKTDTLAENILCLTFTDSGANALRQRLTDIIGREAYKVAIHTFHSFGTEVINQNSQFFYKGANFRPADELSSYEIIRQIFDGLEYSSPLAGKMNGEYTHLRDTLTIISELKKSGLTSDELLMILDANDGVIDKAEAWLAPIFANRIDKTTASQLADHIDPIRASGGSVTLPSIVPLSRVIADSLQDATNQAVEAGSTKPITAWRNRWMKKDNSGAYVLKSRDRQAKLRSVSFVYYKYLDLMQEAELYDFDDMILRVVHAIEVFDELRYNLQEQYQYIMVDEFQDTNMAQMRVLYNLTNNPASDDTPNILVVGDDDQAIYSFQGADVSNIINFRETYPRTQLITLTDNYRSTDRILTSARAIITQGVDRLENHIDEIDKQLTAHSDKPDNVSLLAANTTGDERQWLVEDIKKQIEGGLAPADIAVLTRRHREIIDLLPYFDRAGLTVNYERQNDALELEPIIIIEKLARVLVALHENRHGDANALLPELLAHPAWGIAPSRLWQLSTRAYDQRARWLDIMTTIPDFQPLSTWLIETANLISYTPLEQMLDIMIGKLDSQAPDDEQTEAKTAASKTTDLFVAPFYQYFFSQNQLTDKPDDYIVYLGALRTIRSKLRDYRPGETLRLNTFLEFIDLHRQLGSTISSLSPAAKNDSGAINLMTAHKSKGLEFDTVYITGATDNMWGERARNRSRLIGYPENLPLTPAGETSDERLRLFYVAITRAKRQLIISYSDHDDNDKDLLRAGFLVDDAWPVKSVLTRQDTAAITRQAENRWYDNIVQPTTDLKELLAPNLERYQLSATHLNNFIDITRGGPQTFLLNNLLRFPQAISPAAAYGSAVHDTLRHAHAHLVAAGKKRAIEDILNDYETSLRQQRLSDQDFDTYLQKGLDVLSTFLTERYDTFTNKQKTELSFSNQQVVIGQAHLTGKIDLMDTDEATKEVIVTDYKTGKPANNWHGNSDYEKIKLHKYRQQLMFYKLLIENSQSYSKYQVKRGVLQFVEPSTSGQILALDTEFSSSELDQFSLLIQAIWQHITDLNLPDISQYDQNYKGVLVFEQYLVDTVK